MPNQGKDTALYESCIRVGQVELVSTGSECEHKFPRLLIEPTALMVLLALILLSTSSIVILMFYNTQSTEMNEQITK
jgi:hypothetical protein